MPRTYTKRSNYWERPRVALKNFKEVTFPDIQRTMEAETASILTDYVRQYVGIPSTTPAPGSGIFINWDRVLQFQTYQDLAWYDLYDELERDPHIAGILRSRKLAVAGMPWDVLPGDVDPKAKRKKDGKDLPKTPGQTQAEFVKEKLKNIDGFSQDIFELLGAIGKGFAVSEIDWLPGGVGIAKIWNRPQRRFQFDAVSRTLKLRQIDNPYYGDPVRDKKFIVHRNGSMYENPFGDAVDQSLYWMWLFKKMVLKFWMKYNEVGMASIPIVTHPRTANVDVKNEALSIAEQIRSGAYGRLPADWGILWAEVKSSGMTGESYQKFIEFVNSEMTKCVKGEVLTTEGSGQSGSGSRALGQVHNDVRADITNFDCRGIEGTLNSSIIKWLVDFNFGEQESYPLFKFVPDEPQDKLDESQVVKNLHDAGFSAERDWVEQKFDIELVEKEPEPPPTLKPGMPPFAPKPTEIEQ